MIYKTFNPKVHDLFKVANLIYAVDFKTFDFIFKHRDNAIKCIISDLKKRKYNNYFKVILDNNKSIIGIVNIHTYPKSYDFYFKSLKLILIDILDYFVLCDIKKDDLYIAEIAIDNQMRSQGIGRNVIDDIINYAKCNGFKRVILDVDFRNTKAKSLYEKIGFKVFNKKQFKIRNFKRGMYNMEYKL